jgi:hypothetical protein
MKRLFIIMVILGGAVAWLYTNKLPEKEGVKLPEQQVEFCSIVENAKSKYYDLLHRWSAADEQKNGIVTAQLSGEMTSVYRSRNEDIFRLLERTQFSFENWLMIVVEIKSAINGFVDLKVHPLCSKITIIHATADAVPMYLDLLSKKKLGDRLVMSGTFVQKYSRAKPSSPEKFEMSLTRSGSMDEPEYTAVITIQSSAAPQSNANPAPAVVPSTAPSDQALASPPPTDFRGIKWGSSPAQWMKKIGGPYGPDKLSTWKNPKKLPPFANVPVAEEGYLFQNNKLFGGEMFIDGAQNSETLKAALFDSFGKPTSSDDQLQIYKWQWHNPSFFLMLSYNSKFKRATVHIEKEGPP